MKRRRYYFNMVEMSLALAVVAVGMISVLGVIPVALKSYRDATMDNNIASAAETIRCYLNACHANAASFSGFVTNSKIKNAADNSTDATKPGEPLSWATTGKKIFGSDNMPTAFYFLDNSGDGLFRLQTKPDGTNVELDFLVKLWVVCMKDLPINDVVYGTDANKIPKTLCFTVMAEISYPAEQSAANRQSRTFVYDYYVKE